jgi:hypothetical protein
MARLGGGRIVVTESCERGLAEADAPIIRWDFVIRPDGNGRAREQFA